MFICAVCEKAIGPRIKPIRAITGARPKSYHNEFYVEDELGNRELKKVDSVGTEITGEVLLCPQDAEKYHNIPIVVEKLKVPYPKFEEKQADTFKRPLIDVAAHNTLHFRLEHKSKRAEADNRVTIQGIKEFVDRNTEYKF